MSADMHNTAGQKEAGGVTENQFRRNLEKYAADILSYFKEHRMGSVEDISQAVGLNTQMVYRAIDELSSRGYQIVRLSSGEFELSSSEVKSKSVTQHYWRPTTRILAWCGSEFGSIGQQGDLVATVYQTIAKEEKPDFIIGLGNIVQGPLTPARRNETFLEIEKGMRMRKSEAGSHKKNKKKRNVAELHYRAQVSYVSSVGGNIMSHDSAKPPKTYFVSGLRESDFVKKGFEDPLEALCRMRAAERKKAGKKADWFYLGRSMHYFKIINTGEPVGVLVLTSKRRPFRGVYTRGHRPKKTSSAIAGWLINLLRTRGVEEYPRVVIWSDGTGVYTKLGDSEATTFISLPKLSVTDPGDLEMDTPPNVGCVIIDIMFDHEGRLRPNGVEVKFRNLAPYVKERSYLQDPKPRKNGDLEAKVLKVLEERPARMGDLARILEQNKEAIKVAIARLQKRGYKIVCKETSGMFILERGLRKRFSAIPKETLYTDRSIRKLGFSETHFGGRHSQPHLVARLEEMRASGEFGTIDVIDHAGDVFNGLRHKDYSRGANVLNTADSQHRAGVEVMSIFESTDVFIRPGDHDLWQFSDVGLDMVDRLVTELNLRRRAEGKPENFHYVGSDDFDQYEFRGFRTELKHIMSAQSRGLTTKAQYMTEDRLGDFVKAIRGEKMKKKVPPGLAMPHHIACGNWHREISFFHNGIAIDLYPGLQAPTAWEQGMGIVHKFGAKVITIGLDKYGNIFRYDVRYIDFSDELEVITSKQYEEALLALALKSFREKRKPPVATGEKQES